MSWDDEGNPIDDGSTAGFTRGTGIPVPNLTATTKDLVNEMSARRRQCPGGCGRTLRRTVFACKDCWTSMPSSLRRPISSTIGKPSSPSKTAAWSAGAAHFERGRR